MKIKHSWLISLSTMSCRSIHIVMNGRLCLLKSGSYYSVHIYHVFFIYLSNYQHRLFTTHDYYELYGNVDMSSTHWIIFFKYTLRSGLYYMVSLIFDFISYFLIKWLWILRHYIHLFDLFEQNVSANSTPSSNSRQIIDFVTFHLCLWSVIWFIVDFYFLKD